MKSSKLQEPTSKESVKNSKLQHPTSREYPITKHQTNPSRNWSMRLGASLVVGCWCLVLFAVSAHAQGTGFTYQGRLVQNGTPANGSYSFQFLLRQTSNGAQQGPTL